MCIPSCIEPVINVPENFVHVVASLALKLQWFGIVLADQVFKTTAWRHDLR
jgi:hypothetical protein